MSRTPCGEHERAANTWYEPLEEQADIDTPPTGCSAGRTYSLDTVGDLVLPRVSMPPATRSHHPIRTMQSL